MAIFRIEKTADYTTMSNRHFKDKRLSLKSKGLLSQMLSLPENWDYTLKGLAHINRESIDAIRTAIWELEKAGYACTSYEAGKDDDGASIEWKVVAKKKGLNADYVTVTKFANTDDAEKYEKNVATGSVGGFTVVVKRIGKVCYYGSEQGVKDAK